MENKPEEKPQNQLDKELTTFRAGPLWNYGKTSPNESQISRWEEAANEVFRDDDETEYSGFRDLADRSFGERHPDGQGMHKARKFDASFKVDVVKQMLIQGNPMECPDGPYGGVVPTLTARKWCGMVSDFIEKRNS